MAEDPLILDVKSRMQKAVAVLIEDLGTIRTGRATPALIENTVISSYGGTQNLKLQELATITTEGVRSLIIAPFDQTVIGDIEKGINSANLGFTASVDGSIIRINIPPLTSERRDEFIKLANTKIEGGRIMVRQVRHDVMASLKRSFEAKEISEDDRKRLEKEIQNITDEMMAELEILRHKKEEELNQV
ncbi:ribosome recycling factor [Candidatus Gottesmanbacteria bacterium RIFCSPHIGHO2_02_FULL_40_24]|uniref:Ribosome-recycling factor n=1 Tax=Candidatus Gottesmanbacteria bacterium RIFCSPHIGHO2_01_FULL_40_15 TaxID=1798376 RepID=A0A1F5Z0Q6_9BACT|nr:MAG: ribosome recycling factor [Candidatus Gottesmanbacteria bacterium RIFCSPHIGHO2_01_FULL_40_15]OGG17470.1 MAG: ribosome recycling factor [Candidatus Gottesmanbacteria bacterium RIFCSPHIGHO2_02_FULL_40_24]OGG25113.1 MAG: ribosome recycling factor [Candidatus Gottesmanbacteria bacterium RIFCSPHIGHO2_12_FULL_40_13]OGG32766.1 MAG: ribosome recycling factor [Candidatus Gottesmanbacteria bacterium RIFCSPLOWO2_02_FULL_40_10]